MIKVKIIDNLNLVKDLKLTFGRGAKKGQGGDGGQILIVSEKIKGKGAISTDGGDGLAGGKGGKIHIKTKQNLFSGKISAKGGKAVIKK